MHNPWPSADEAVAMPVEDLALRVLDRLGTSPDDPFHSLYSRQPKIHCRSRVLSRRNDSLVACPQTLTR
jgi:hypothetical protein